jgi:predicted outer membrane repeat protein
VILRAGAEFTQADIDAGSIAYQHTSTSDPFEIDDDFEFALIGVSNVRHSSNSRYGFRITEVRSLQVNTTENIVDETDGKTNLKEALNLAYDLPGHNEITFAPALGGQTITLWGELAIHSAVTITAPPGGITIASNSGRVFSVWANQSLTASGLTITSGNGDGFFSSRGGIKNVGTLVLNSCTLAGNINEFDGGALHNTGSATLTNCTLAGNRASGRGGAIYSTGTLNLVHCTVANNNGNSEGGGLYTSGTTTLKSTLLALNTATTGPDWRTTGSTSYAYFSLISNNNGSLVSGNDNQINIAPGLETGTDGQPTLANNGGIVKTIKLLWNSPALEAGSSYGINSDARGLPRPFNLKFKSGAGDQSDIGAYEQQADTIAPEVALLSPAFGQVISTTTFPSLNGTASDNTGRIARVEVLLYRKNSSNIAEYWNGTGWVPGSNSVLPATLTATATGATWQLSSSLPAGDAMRYGSIYTRVQTWDAEGNASPRVYSQFTLKNSTPPLVEISSPAHGSRVTSSTFPGLQGFATDRSASGIARVEVVLYYKNSSGVAQYWNGSAWVSSSTGCILRSALQPSSGGAGWTLSRPLPGGSNLLYTRYTVRSQAFDRNGNASTRLYTTFDLLRPSTTETTAASTSDGGSATSNVKLSRSSALADSVELVFTGSLDVTTATEAASYRILVNNAAVEVDAVTYDAATRTVRLGLGAGALHAGDVVDVQCRLRDAQHRTVNVATSLKAR